MMCFYILFSNVNHKDFFFLELYNLYKVGRYNKHKSYRSFRVNMDIKYGILIGRYLE